MCVRELLVNKLKDKGWSVLELSRRSNVPPTTIYGIIKNKSRGNYKTLSRIAAVFSCNVEDFYSINPAQEKNFDYEITQYCFLSLNKYLMEKNTIISQRSEMKIVDNLVQYCCEKKDNDLNFELDNPIIELLFINGNYKKSD